MAKNTWNIGLPVSFLIVQKHREDSCCDDENIVNAKADRDLVDAMVEATVERPQNAPATPVVSNEEGKDAAKPEGPVNVMLFKTKTCPNCKAAEAVLNKSGVDYTEVYADDDKNLSLVEEFQVMRAPTLVIEKDGEVEKYVGVSDIVGWIKTIK